jgi:hypothetical protein
MEGLREKGRSGPVRASIGGRGAARTAPTRGQPHARPGTRHGAQARIRGVVPRAGGTRAPGPSLLDPYLPHLVARHRAGCANGHALWREIRAMGYGGTHRQVLRWLNQRCREPAPSTAHARRGNGSMTRDPPRRAALAAATGVGVRARRRPTDSVRARGRRAPGRTTKRRAASLSSSASLRSCASAVGRTARGPSPDAGPSTDGSRTRGVARSPPSRPSRPVSRRTAMRFARRRRRPGATRRAVGRPDHAPETREARDVRPRQLRPRPAPRPRGVIHAKRGRANRQSHLNFLALTRRAPGGSRAAPRGER